MNHELLAKYFPSLTDRQKEQFAALDGLYRDWNSKINVISRKDIDNLYEHHVLHSLAIAEFIRFRPGTRIMDLGTGGGFPGIPLAILFPEARFHLVDSIGKKIRVCQEVSKALSLENVTTQWCRAEEVREQFHFIVSRAVTDLSQFSQWVRGKVSDIQYHHLRNGILYLKGGDLDAELAPFKKKVRTWDISDFFAEEYFQTKKVVHLPIR